MRRGKREMGWDREWKEAWTRKGEAKENGGVQECEEMRWRGEKGGREEEG